MTQSVSQWVTGSPIELFWTAKNISFDQLPLSQLILFDCFYYFIILFYRPAAFDTASSFYFPLDGWNAPEVSSLAHSYSNLHHILTNSLIFFKWSSEMHVAPWIFSVAVLSVLSVRGCSHITSATGGGTANADDCWQRGEGGSAKCCRIILGPKTCFTLGLECLCHIYSH